MLDIYLFIYLRANYGELSGQRVETANGTAFSSNADNLSVKFSRLAAPQGHRPFITTYLYRLVQLLTSPLEYATTGS